MKRFAAVFVTPMLVAAVFVSLSARPASAQDWARARLEKSSRHSEWVTVKHGDRSVETFVVYPEIEAQAACGAGDSRNLRLDGLGPGSFRRSGGSRLHRRDARSAFRNGARRRPHVGFCRRQGDRGGEPSRSRPGYRGPERRRRLRAETSGVERQTLCRRLLLGRRPEFPFRDEPSRPVGGFCLLRSAAGERRDGPHQGSRVSDSLPATMRGLAP